MNPPWRSPLLPPPSKKPRLQANSKYQFAGAEQEALFPEGKTTLNNALQIHLHRLGERLEYSVTSVYIPELTKRIFRASVQVPYPKPFVAYGEGENRKEAEKRSSSAACVKLCEMGVIDNRGKRIEKHHGLIEDQKPKTLEIALEGQLQLFDAIAGLPQASSFPNWASLKNYYDTQKRINPTVGSTLFQITFSCNKSSVTASPVATGLTHPPPSSSAGENVTPSVPYPVKVKVEPPDPSDPTTKQDETKSVSLGMQVVPAKQQSSQSSTTTNIVLPARFKSIFPARSLTPLASIPCPGCHEPISITITQASSSVPPTPIDAHPQPPLPPSTGAADSLPRLPGGGVARIKQEPPSSSGQAQPSYAPLLNIKQEPGESETQCVFTGTPYKALSEGEIKRRNHELQRQQEEVRKRFSNAKPNSPQYTAQRLPAANMRNAILTEINTQPVVIVSGMTGSGKTTQVPQYILENYIEHGIGASCNIIVTQPRRISAISIAERVATERGERVGLNVGYQVRLESCVPKSPGRILYCTTGILLMRLRKNPFLEGVSHVIVDEVHERDVNTDFLLILLREIARSSSSEVKIVLMSASLNAQMFVQYFRSDSIRQVPCVQVQGHCYPVTEHFLDEVCGMIGWKASLLLDDDPDMKTDLVASTVVHLASSEPMGAILVFLPGWDEIMSVLDLLQSKLRRAEHHRYLILPLHSMLSSADQQKVFQAPPVGVRKIILATNIAESSVTIDDIVYVVNSGTLKVKTFDPIRKISCLVTQLSSQASVTQRRGRAGRCQPGHCYNLFTKAQFRQMSEYEVPEMQRTPLEELVLLAKVLNPWQPVRDFLSKALNPPIRTAVSAAVSGLVELGALDSKEALTPLGKVLAELPIEPRVGRLILLGMVFGTLDPILTIAASLGYKDPFVSPPSKRQEADQARTRLASGCYSDHLLLVKAYRGWQESLGNNQEFVFIRENFLHRGGLKMIEGLRKQFVSHLERLGMRSLEACSKFGYDEGMIRAVLTAGLYPSVVRMAKMMESGGMRGETQRKRLRQGFKTLQDGRVFMHPSSVNSERNFPSNWFVYHEKVKTSKVYIRDSSLIHPLHLLLFSGTSLNTVREDGDVAVLTLDDNEFFAFEMALHLSDLLRCAREAIKLVVNTGLTAQGSQLGHLPESQTKFIEGLCNFLSSHATFTLLVE